MSHQARRARFRQAVRQQLSRVPLWVWMLVCLAIAAFYVVVWPSDQAPANPSDLRYIILRWFHPLAWVFLALSCLIRMLPIAQPTRTKVANLVALLAVPAYAGFFLMVVTT